MACPGFTVLPMFCEDVTPSDGAELTVTVFVTGEGVLPPCEACATVTVVLRVVPLLSGELTVEVNVTVHVALDATVIEEIVSVGALKPELGLPQEVYVKLAGAPILLGMEAVKLVEPLAEPVF